MTQRHDLELFLKQVEMFRRLPAKDRQRLASLSHDRTFDKGETIFQEGRPSDSIWLVMEGRVHLVHALSTGHMQTSCVITPGESFCCLPALDRGAYPATAVAAVKARVLQVPSWIFHELMGGSPDFLKETLCVFATRLRQVEARACLLHDPVEKRLAQALLALQKKFGDTIPLTKQEIAEVVGTTVETAIRVVSRFQKEGWVRSSRGKIQLLDPARLNQLLT